MMKLVQKDSKLSHGRIYFYILNCIHAEHNVMTVHCENSAKYSSTDIVTLRFTIRSLKLTLLINKNYEKICFISNI